MTKTWPDIAADISVTRLLHSSSLVGEGGMWWKWGIRVELPRQISSVAITSTATEERLQFCNALNIEEKDPLKAQSRYPGR